LVLITITLITIVGLSFRAGLYVGLVTLTLSTVIYAVAIALFSLCMASG
jgi:hypothetical protein